HRYAYEGCARGGRDGTAPLSTERLVGNVDLHGSRARGATLGRGRHALGASARLRRCLRARSTPLQRARADRAHAARGGDQRLESIRDRLPVSRRGLSTRVTATMTERIVAMRIVCRVSLASEAWNGQ